MASPYTVSLGMRVKRGPRTDNLTQTIPFTHMDTQRIRDQLHESVDDFCDMMKLGDRRQEEVGEPAQEEAR